MTPLQRLVRRLGYDLTSRKKAKPLEAQLTAVLERIEITCVLDVGANTGQYGRLLRTWGYRGRIVSFEPLAAAHARLELCAAGDTTWQVAPRMALGARDGEVTLEVAAESDMSSILPQTELLRRISPSSRVIGRERVPIRRLDGLAEQYLKPDEGIFLKVDTQGLESEVLAGARQLLPRLRGIQLEMSLVRCYEGERDFREVIDDLEGAGFRPWLFFPGYFEHKLARQLQIDGVFVRAPD